MTFPDLLAPLIGRPPLATPAAVLEYVMHPERLDEPRDRERARKDQTYLWHKVVTAPGELPALPSPDRYPALYPMLFVVKRLESEIATLRRQRVYQNRGAAFKAACERRKLQSSTLLEVTRGVAWINFYSYCQIMEPVL